MMVNEFSLFQLQADLKAKNEKLEEEISKHKQTESAIGKRMIALTQPSDNWTVVDIGELFDIAELQKLQDQFSSAFGVASIITQPDGTPITKPSNFSRLCQSIIRCTEKGLLNCMHSDAVIGRHNPEGPVVQACLSGGLLDAGASITIGGKHVANWLIGQVRNKIQEVGKLEEYARQIGADEADFMQAYREIPSMSETQFQKIADLLFSMAGQLSDMAYHNAQQAHFINERKQAEAALVASEARFRTTLYSIGDGVITTDSEGRVSLMNPVAEQLTGWSQTEAAGKMLEEIFHIINESTRALVEIPVRRVLREGVIVGLANHTLLVAKDGTERPIADSGAPILNGNGEIVGVVLVFRDQTEERKAEKAMKSSELKFRSLFENAAIGISITNFDGSMKMNKAFCEILGYSETELQDKKWQEITDPDDIQKSINVVNSLLQGEAKIIRFEKKYLHKSGAIVWADVNAKLERDENNNPVHFITSISDITERKKVERALRKADEKMDAFFNQSLDGFFFMKLDQPIEWNEEADKEQLLEYAFLHMKIVRVNDAMLAQYGAVCDQFLGLNLHNFFAHDIQQGKNLFRELFSKGKFHTETKERKLNGETMFIDGDYTCLYDSRGWINGLFGIQRDITEQKKAIETIQKLSMSIEQSPSTIVISDVLGNIEYVNPKFIEVTGYTSDEVIGQNPRLFQSGETPPEKYRELWKTISSGEVWRGEFRNRKKNGELYWEWATMTSIKNEKGEITNYIAIKEDISSHKKMEVDLIIAKEKAEENDRLKSAFLANMSHEIRTPLNSIIGFAELLSDPDFEQDERYEFASLIGASGNNLLAIITNIMDISKIEAGQVEVNKCAFNAQKLIDDVHNEYKFRALDKGIDMRIASTTPDEDCSIYSDQIKIKQVLINFVGNALKFTGNGFIEIGIKVNNESVEFFVKDTGLGISDTHREQIFERFRQVEDSSTRKYGGNGLGLAISKSLIELLGGTIGMESEPGKGSRFYFILPKQIEINNIDLPI